MGNWPNMEMPKKKKKSHALKSEDGTRKKNTKKEKFLFWRLIWSKYFPKRQLIWLNYLLKRKVISKFFNKLIKNVKISFFGHYFDGNLLKKEIILIKNWFMLSKIQKNSKKILKIIKKFPWSILSAENLKKAKITQHLIDLYSKDFKNLEKLHNNFPYIYKIPMVNIGLIAVDLNFKKFKMCPKNSKT